MRTSRETRSTRVAPRTGAAFLVGVFLVLAVTVPVWTADLDLSGTWAELKVLSDSVTYPLVGAVVRVTTLLQSLTIAQTGRDLAILATYCSVAFDNGPSLSTVVDPTFPPSVAAIRARGSLGDSAAFVQSDVTEVHGARLDDPESDPLPTSASDPRVFDQDGDGHPGITVHARAFGLIAGDVYVVQRLRTRLDGQAVSSDRIEGQVAGTVEQVILGATNALFLGAIVSQTDPVAANSHFILQRVDPTWTCGEILLHRAALFEG